MRRYLAEFIGTFGLVFAGCGAIVVNALTEGRVTHVGIGLTFGLVIAVMIYATGYLSGAHLNPAVSLAFAVTRHFPGRDLLPYWTAQLTGGMAAGAALRLLFGPAASLGATLPRGPAWQSLVLEGILTFLLMFVIMAMATDGRAVGQSAALAIGATVGLEALFAGPISGASMNPARSFGPALASGAFTHHWVYWAGPCGGALLGALAYEGLRGSLSS